MNDENTLQKAIRTVRDLVRLEVESERPSSAALIKLERLHRLIEQINEEAYMRGVDDGRAVGYEEGRDSR